MANKPTKADLEAENASLNEALDAVTDALEDDELSATRKVSAALEELDKLEDEGDQEDDQDEGE